MYISEYMTSEPITITTDTSITEARSLLNEHHFRHLPVVDGENHLLGVISDRDLRSAYPSTVSNEAERKQMLDLVQKTPVSEIMTVNCSCLRPDSTLDDALFVFARDKIGALPVLDDEERVVGLFSIRDLTYAYKNLFGVGEKGSVLIAVKDDGSANIMSRLVSLLEANNITFTRLLRVVGKNKEKKIYLRINTFKVVNVHKFLIEEGFDIL